MFLSQVPHTPGLEVPVIVDLDPDLAREACRTVNSLLDGTKSAIEIAR